METSEFETKAERLIAEGFEPHSNQFPGVWMRVNRDGRNGSVGDVVETRLLFEDVKAPEGYKINLLTGELERDSNGGSVSGDGMSWMRP